jgi:fibronectin type 3 domain-containing protein
MIYSSSFRYAVLFANNRNKAAGLSNQVLIKPLPIPLPPSGLSAEITEGSINLKWALPSENMDGSKPARIAGYNIYKAEEPRMLPAAPINSDPVQNPAYEDHSFQFDKTYYYAVSIVGNIANPRAESQLSEVLSAVSRDVFPPAPPKNFTALPDGGSILLLWAPSVSPDVAGYRIYRIEEGTKTEQLLQNELIITLSYRDNHVNSDKRCQYRILAVDTHGNESTPVLAAVEIQ